MMMIDDDDDDNRFRSSSSPFSWIIMVMMMMMMTIMIIFSDLPHCLCPSSVVSCHWPLLPKMGWFVIINLVIVKLFVFFSIEPAACIQQVGVRSISLPLPLPMQTKLKFYRSF